MSGKTGLPVYSLIRWFLSVLLILSGIYFVLILYSTGSELFHGIPLSSPATALIVFSGILVLWFCTGKKNVRYAGILFGLTLITYLANGRTISAGDSLPARYLPLSILRDGDFYLDEARGLYRTGLPYYLVKISEHYVSAYPVGAAIVATPVYIPVAIGSDRMNPRFMANMEKIAASLIVALSAGILFLALRRVTDLWPSLLIAAIYAFGSSSLSTSSQALWQHGPAQLSIVSAIYCILRNSTSRWFLAAGFAMGLAVVCRPPNLLLLLPVGLYVLFHQRQHFLSIILGGLPWAFFQVWYNRTYFGDLFHFQFSGDSGRWNFFSIEALAGLLMSPARGLFVYSPVFLFAIPGAFLAWKKQGHPLLKYLSISVLTGLIIYSSWKAWWGGFSYGPRLLADLIPFFSLLLLPMVSVLRKNKATLALFVVFSICSFYAHFNGAYFDDGQWNSYWNVDRNKRSLWMWNDNQLVNPVQFILKRAWIDRKSMPSNKTNPELLDASYEFEENPEISLGGRSESGTLHFCAKNTGKAVWLSGERGANDVRFLSRWRRQEEIQEDTMESIAVRRDVLTHECYRFRLNLTFPQRPGIYSLEMGMTSGAGWFGNSEMPPLKFEVTVGANGNRSSKSLTSGKITFRSNSVSVK